jgi:hypothetical protein
MRELAILAIHLIVTLAKLLRSGGGCEMAAESFATDPGNVLQT